MDPKIMIIVLSPQTILQRLGELFFATQCSHEALALAQEMRNWRSDLLSSASNSIEIRLKVEDAS